MNDIPRALVKTWLDLAYQEKSVEVSNISTKKILDHFGNFEAAELYVTDKKTSIK